jgi:hypothetical protein
MSNIMAAKRLFMFMLNLYKNRKNTMNKGESSRFYLEARPVSEVPMVPLPPIDMLSCLK